MTRIVYSTGPSYKKNEEYVLDNVPPDMFFTSKPFWSSRRVA